jgi:hypothetical protein
VVNFGVLNRRLRAGIRIIRGSKNRGSDELTIFPFSGKIVGGERGHIQSLVTT